MQDQYVKDGNYYVVQSFMIKELHLKGLELSVYAIIYGFSQNEQGFCGTLSYLQEWTNSSQYGVLKILQSLVSSGLVTKEDVLINGVNRCRYRAAYTPKPLNKVEGGSQQSLVGGLNKVEGGSQQSLDNNISNSISNNISNIPPIPPEGDCPADETESADELLFSEPKPKMLPKLKVEGFDDFWAVYPRRDAKKAAIRAWEKLNPSPETRQRIIAAVLKARTSPQWMKDNGSFIPLPATYINGQRWEDEAVNLAPPPKQCKPLSPSPTADDWFSSLNEDTA